MSGVHQPTNNKTITKKNVAADNELGGRRITWRQTNNVAANQKHGDRRITWRQMTNMAAEEESEDF